MSVGELEKALMKLNDDFREVIVLRDIQQLTYEEIAEITDTAMGTVKSRINRARQQLQSLIGEYVNPETI
jgi:RNA polymerase sigma-70 factor (ECF subfamily)